MGSNNPSGNERDQFSPEAGEKPKKMIGVSINVSFDILVDVPEDYTKDLLNERAEMFRQWYGIKEQVANVEENI